MAPMNVLSCIFLEICLGFLMDVRVRVAGVTRYDGVVVTLSVLSDQSAMRVEMLLLSITSLYSKSSVLYIRMRIATWL